MKSDAVRQQARAMKYEGYTFKEISEVLGITYDAVRNLCNYKKTAHPKKCGRHQKITKANAISIKRAIARLKILPGKSLQPEN